MFVFLLKEKTRSLQAVPVKKEHHFSSDVLILSYFIQGLHIFVDDFIQFFFWTVANHRVDYFPIFFD